MRTRIDDLSDIERVGKGVAFMNHNVGPGWEHKIDLATFNMSHSSFCVLGQSMNHQAYDALYGLFGVDWIIRHAFSDCQDLWKMWIQDALLSGQGLSEHADNCGCGAHYESAGYISDGVVTFV